MLKRSFDVLMVLVTAPFWMSLIVLVAIALRITSRGPLLFIQQRAGRHGQPFNLYKFRTMTNARNAEGELLSDAERLTRTGRLLRQTSLDELPQMINVLRGDMSLVGPRPLLMEYLPLYTEHHRRRHEVRPGITGLAQVNGRNQIKWDDRLDLDVEYVDTHSLWLDALIIARTVKKVITRHGVSGEGEPTMRPYRGPGS